MKILTWNLERPSTATPNILDKLAQFDADILVLTETNAAINPGEAYCCLKTETLTKGFDGIDYKTGENRTTIWSKYKIYKQHKTYDRFTAVCAEIETEIGLLNVYGTIIGVFGGRGERFKQDLDNQLLDFERLCDGNSFCIVGDFNVTFSGFIYPSRATQNTLKSVFEKLNLENLTSSIPNNVDHVVMSKNLLVGRKYDIEIWNEDKTLSDHIGVCILIS